MTGLGKGLLLSACGLIIAGAASAAVPNRANSSFPANGIYLVGNNAGGTVDIFGEFSVTVRDINNNPVVTPPAVVSVNFGGCTTDLRLSSQTFPGVSSAGCVVNATVNGLGVATFRIRGGALNAGNSPGAGFECAVISANGVFLNNVTAAAIDQGPIVGPLTGVTGLDLSILLGDLFTLPSPPAVGRSDYNFSDSVTPLDLSVWVGAFFHAAVPAGGSPQNGGVLAGCP